MSEMNMMNFQIFLTCIIRYSVFPRAFQYHGDVMHNLKCDAIWSGFLIDYVINMMLIFFRNKMLNEISEGNTDFAVYTMYKCIKKLYQSLQQEQ